MKFDEKFDEISPGICRPHMLEIFEYWGWEDCWFLKVWERFWGVINMHNPINRGPPWLIFVQVYISHYGLSCVPWSLGARKDA